jgi:hypothetical protein
MPGRPQIQITSGSASPSATPGERLGTWFVAAQTERGPAVPDQARPLYSLSDYTATYGSRNASLGSVSTTYDLLDAFWQSGGGAVYLARVVGPAAVAASLTLSDRAGSPLSTLKVTALGAGTWANTNVTISVANGVAANSFVITVLIGTVATEVSPDLFSPTDAVAWSQTSKYVRVTDLASASTAPTNNPAVLAATALASGVDDLGSITDIHWTNALNALPAEWGPGLVSKLGISTSAGHAGTLAHAAANNRFAILDGASASSQATLTSLAATVQTAATAPEYGALFAPWVQIPPFAGGTASRTVPPSGVVAGLISKQVTSGAANAAAAGANGQARIVLAEQANVGFTTTERDTLNGTAPVNVIRRPYSASLTPPYELYGYNTLAKPGNGWRQAGSQLLRLRLTDELSQVAETFLFGQFDGKGQLLAEFAGALVEVLRGHFDDGELYGASPADAYEVDVTSVNTTLTLAQGQLNARVSVRISPMAEYININVTKVPVTESLSA